MVLPMLAALLPGLASTAKKFVSGVAGDVLAGKGIGASLKDNAIKTVEGVIPGAGSVIQGAVAGAQKLIAGRKMKQLGAPEVVASAAPMAKAIEKMVRRANKYKKLKAKGRGEPSGVSV
jgi:hypothetical protein